MIGTGKKKAKPKAPPRRSILLESLTRSKPERVDREAGVIYGVKIIGLQSENDRRYTLAALGKAKSLYENLVVNIDHPGKPNESRSAQDRLGKLANVRLTEDGLYADLHILKSHPMAERLLEAAETMPDLFGMSHNAQGTGTSENGVFIVEEITEVRSVDLVADPATTKSLFESKRRTVKTTLRKLLESWKPKKAPVAKQLKALFEDDDVPLDMEMDAPADDAGPVDDGMGGLTDAIAGIVKSGNHDLAMKVLKLIQKESEPAEAPVAEEESDDEGDDDEKDVEEAEDDDKEKDYKESRQPKKAAAAAAKVINWERAHDLCEEHKVAIDKPLVRALCKLTEDEAKGLLAREKRLLESKSSSTWNDPPRSQGRDAGKSTSGSPRVKNYQSFLESIQN